MHIAFLNPQGNFDSADTGWTLHPDFGGQLVYVKEVALAMGRLGHSVDIITRQIIDSDWPEFSDATDSYPGNPNVRIIRFPCGPESFLPKEKLWSHLPEWVDNILSFYGREKRLPVVFTTHYADGGFAGALIKSKTKVPFTFTGHSLGAQKMDKFIHNANKFEEVVEQFHFDKRIVAERLAMKYSDRIFTSTTIEKNNQYGHHLYEGTINTSDEKVAVVPPGVNLKIFNQDNPNKLELEVADKIHKMIQRDISKGRRNLPMVICSSRLDRRKNHLDLVKAWAVNRNLRESANLAIIVRGTEDPIKNWLEIFAGEENKIFSEIIAVIESYDLKGYITAFDLNGQLELAACYRHLAKNLQGIFALTAHYEPFGLAPLEAIASGLPAVVTKNGGTSESLQDDNGVYGVLVDPQNPKDIAEGILKLVNKKFWEEMQSAGIKRVEEKYTWVQTAKAYLKELELILSDYEKNRTDIVKNKINLSNFEIEIENFKKQYYVYGGKSE